MKVGFFGGKFLPLHQGHVNCIFQASTLVDKLYVVLSHSKERDRFLCQRDNCKYISKETRLHWLYELTKKQDNIALIDLEDNCNVDNYDWEAGAKLLKEKIVEPIDIVFGSDPDYKDIFNKNYPGAEYILVDFDRNQNFISATEIRSDVYQHWEMLPDFVKPFFVKKVAVIGTESCGKSTLVNKLAQLYNTTSVEEYGRKYCEKKGGPETLVAEDYRNIVYTHKLLELEAVKKANKIVFIDTEATVTKYYAELYNDYYDQLFSEIAKHQDYDLYLFLEPDIEWVDDGQRKHGDLEVRLANNQRLKKMFDEQGIDYVTIKGSYQERLCLALEQIDQLFKEDKK